MNTDRPETKGFATPLDRFAPWILAAAIIVSAVVAMHLGRGSTFTGDEMVWIVSSPGMDLSTALQSHGGHLQLIPRGIYKLMLETVGTTYWPYRLLTVAAMALLSVLLYRYLVRRAGPTVALVPSILMLFFGADALHVIRGNGFTIIFSIACGIGALLAIERRDLKGDALACFLLVCGVATYTLALPFVAGVALALLLGRNWKRLWVPAVPLLLYTSWRIWLQATANLNSNSTVHLSSLDDIPRWIFDALSAILSAITGLGYGFTNTSVAGPDDLIGPLLAAAALVALAWRLSRGSIPRSLWVSLAIGFILWSIQSLASDPSLADYRAPSDPRYLYPGAVVVFLIAGDLVAGMRWTRAAFTVFVAVAAFGIASNIAQMNEYGKANRTADADLRRFVTAVGIFYDESGGHRVEPSSEPVVVENTDLIGAVLATMAQRPYGGIDYSLSEIASRPQAGRLDIDETLAGYQAVELSKGDPGAKRCRMLEPAAGGGYVAKLPSGEVTLKSGRFAGIARIGRFSSGEPIVLGPVPARSIRGVSTPEPFEGPRWRISFSRPGLKLCSRTAPVGPGESASADRN